MQSNEGCRIPAHIFKDTSRLDDDWVPENKDWSRFMERACDEAMEALICWNRVEDLRLKSNGSWRNWGAFQVTTPSDAAAQKSKGAWTKGKGKHKGMNKGKDMGKDKGKAKGKGMTKGKGMGKGKGHDRHLARGPSP